MKNKLPHFVVSDIHLAFNSEKISKEMSLKLKFEVV